MQEKETAALDTNTLRHQFQELQERASKDALSGLLNRQTAESYISARLKEMTAEQTCALFIIDLDHFKQVNDTLGHQAGDWAIRQSAKTLSGLFRARDIIGRLGGDEFIVFLSGQITEKLVRKKGAAPDRSGVRSGPQPVCERGDPSRIRRIARFQCAVSVRGPCALQGKGQRAA